MQKMNLDLIQEEEDQLLFNHQLIIIKEGLKEVNSASINLKEYADDIKNNYFGQFGYSITKFHFLNEALKKSNKDIFKVLMKNSATKKNELKKTYLSLTKKMHLVVHANELANNQFLLFNDDYNLKAEKLNRLFFKLNEFDVELRTYRGSTKGFKDDFIKTIASYSKQASIGTINSKDPKTLFQYLINPLYTLLGKHQTDFIYYSKLQTITKELDFTIKSMKGTRDSTIDYFYNASQKLNDLKIELVEELAKFEID